MTRFDELCESYLKLLKGAADYENDCKSFTKKLVQGFIDYLECGRNDLIIKELSLNDDGYYHCAIELTVYEGQDRHAAKGLVPEVSLRVSRDGEHFLVRFATGTEEFFVSKNQTENLQSEEHIKIYDAMFRGIKSYYETPVDEFIRRNMKGNINFG
jgi:hypothetical protein